MSEMISVASGFQYSVNIGYDLNNDAKLKNFIPTQSALQLLSDVLDSTAVTSTAFTNTDWRIWKRKVAHCFDEPFDALKKGPFFV